MQRIIKLIGNIRNAAKASHLIESHPHWVEIFLNVSRNKFLIFLVQLHARKWGKVDFQQFPVKQYSQSSPDGQNWPRQSANWYLRETLHWGQSFLLLLFSNFSTFNWRKNEWIRCLWTFKFFLAFSQNWSPLAFFDPDIFTNLWKNEKNFDFQKYTFQLFPKMYC